MDLGCVSSDPHVRKKFSMLLCLVQVLSSYLLLNSIN